MIHRRILVLLLSLILVSCGLFSAAVPTATNEIPDTQPVEAPVTQEATDTPTAMAPAEPTETPASMLRPTWTPPPAASPTPQGLYISEIFSFSMILPEGWEILDESDSLIFGNRQTQVIALTASFVDPEGPSPTAYEDFISGFTDGEQETVIYEGETTFKDGTPVSYAVTNYIDNNGVESQAYLYYAYQEPREYIFVIFGPVENAKAAEETITNLIKNVQPLGTAMLGSAREDTLVLYGGGDPVPESLDPARTTSGSAGLTGLLYSGLVSLSPQMQIVPDLAESWTVSPDGTVYTFKINPKAYFSSGRPITADDFKYSWERAANPDTASTVAMTYMGDILGFKEMNKGEADEISGVKVIDELTLEVTLDAPKPYFLAKLTYPTSFVVARESVVEGSDDWLFEPNASGPFRLKSYIPQTTIVFEPNPGHPNPSQLSAMVYRLYLPGKSIDYYQQDEIDIAYVGDPADIRAITSQDNPLNAELQTTTSMCTTMIQLNNNLAPFDDPNVRKAFALAIDTQKISDQFSEGTDLLAHTVLPPAMPGFSSSLAADAFDPVAAKEALQASAYAQDMPTVIVYDSGYAGEESDYTNALVSMWQENLGVDVQVEYLDPVNYSRDARAGESHIVLYGWCADYPDPENFLDVLYHTDSEFNVARYANAELDQLLEKARTEIDPANRISLYQQAESLLLADHAVIPMNHGVYFVLVKPFVKGFILSPIHNRVFDQVTIER